MNDTTATLQQHELVILRRLRDGPLTEFELAEHIADASGHTQEHAADMMSGWLEALRGEGLIWAGKLSNASDQQIMAAALTNRGRELVH